MSKSVNGDFSAGHSAPPGRKEDELPRSYVVPILSKALTIMDLIESSEEPLSARRIHELLGYPPATIYRILRTLAAHGVIKGYEHTSYSFRRIAEVRSVIGRGSNP